MQSGLTRGRAFPRFCEARCGARGCSLGSQSEHGVQRRGPVLGRPGPRPAQGRGPIGLALIDQDERVRQMLAGLTEAGAEFVFRVSFATAQAALAAIPGLDVEVVVTEMALPDLCGIRCARQLLAVCPELAVIIASAVQHPLLIRRAFAVGASQYLVKPVRPGQFLATLRFVSCRRRVPAAEAGRAQSFLQATLGRRSATASQQAGGADAHPPGSRATMRGSGVVDVLSEHSLQAKLTAQEVEMLQYLAQGLVWKEIEERLQVSHCTLRSMKRRLFLKLDHARNRTEALAKWYQTQQTPGQPHRS